MDIAFLLSIVTGAIIGFAFVFVLDLVEDMLDKRK